MDKIGFNLVKDFFPKETSLGKRHPATCGCDICQSCDDLFDDLTKITKNLLSRKVKTSNPVKICKFLDRESLESLNCVNAAELDGPLGHLKQIWETDVEGKSISNLNNVHEENCGCLLCSVKNELISKFDEFCSSKSLDDDILEILQGNKWDDEEVSDQVSSSHEEVNKESDKDDDEKQFLICEQNNPILLTVKNGTVLSAVDVNSGSEMLSEKQLSTPSKEDDKFVMKNVNYFDLTEEDKSEPVEMSNLQETTLKEIQLDELVDICLCEPGKLSPYCLKHSVAYCQHMQIKLYEEGCTCTRQNECLFCQRLKCNFCSHERKMSACPFLVDEETDDVAMKVSSWLDSKLLEVGVQPEVIDELNESMPRVKSDETAKEVIPELSDHLADHIGRSLLDSPMLNSVPLDCNFEITSEMESDILNMNELFDIRSFPRCYRLKGIKNGKGVYTDIDEEFMEVGFNAWKLPTQFIEETVPLASADPDLEARLDKEEDIRRRTKTQKTVLNQQKVCIKGLTDDWQPIIEICPDDSDYNEISTEEEKELWARKTYEEIMEKCCVSMEPKEVNETWSRVQPILDKYCEERPVEMNASPGPFAARLSDFDSFLNDTMKSAENIIKKFPCDTIGYKPEFWKGLEDWRPDKNENEVYKCLIDEVKRLYKELDSFKNDFERILINNPGDPVDPELVLNNIIGRLPEELAAKINQIKSRLPSNLLNNPESALMELKKSSKQTDEFLMKKLNRIRIQSESKSESVSSHKLSESGGNDKESFHDSDEEFQEDSIGKREAYFYDDEEVMDDVIEPEGSKAEDIAIIMAEDGEASIQSSFKATTSKGFKSASLLPHTPAPYVEKLKEEMLINNPDGLHPVQQLWYDRPMYPFWTPTVVYDLSDLEKTLLSDVPEYSPDISEDELKVLEEKLLNSDCKQSTDDRSPVDNKAKNLSLDNSALPTSPDSIDSSVIETKDKIAIETDAVKGNTDFDKDNENQKIVKKTASDDDCLIKEDDFKHVIEQMLKAQEMKKETVKNDLEDAGGALGLEQILKGIAGTVLSQKDGAIELDTRQEINLESVVPHPALKYPFKLDIFQKQAIIALEAGLSVFVSAHTSAGKTVAAEYAIAMAQRNGCRVVYTSPIKALSNQKYNDFTKKFKGNIKVGIITGDVQLNRDAECLIMTTEILRSMLYNQSSILSDLEFVVFDEVHYFNDPERGNVWEEVLILLPQQCQLIMLSATVPNVMNFASWVGSLRKRTVIVASTTKRPVPLKHFIHFSTEGKYVEKVLPLKDAEGPFLSDSYTQAMSFKRASSKGKYDRDRPNPNQQWERFIKKHLKERQRLPVVIFCFSRKRCDDLAMGIRSIDLVQNAKEKAHIELFISRQINMLQPEDRDIKQIVTMKTLLTRGIGVHHSGMLPILKEIVEVLFSKSQIKLLFATETFAMGVNMPAKTVVFQQTRKFDGIDYRALKPAEYTQMAGRAGRRGIDKSGTAIITEWNRPDYCIEEVELKNMLTGNVDPLQSQFRLRYSMILTALKPEGGNSIHAIIGKSFFNFSFEAQRNLAEILKERGDKCLMEIAEEMRTIQPALRERLSDYCNITHQLFSLHDTIRDKMFEHRSIKKYLTCGRLVTVCYKKYVNVFGIIVGVDKVGSNKTSYDIVVLSGSQLWVQPLKTRYPEATQEDEDNWYRLVGFRKMELHYVLGSIESHDTLDLLHCKANHICRIVKNSDFKINKNEAQTICEVLKNPNMYSKYPNTILNSLTNYLNDCLRKMHSYILLDENFRFNDEGLRKEVLKYHKLSQAFAENLNDRLNRMEDEYLLLHYLQTCFWFYEKKKKEDRRKVEAQKEELKWLFKDFDSKLIFLKNNKYIKEDDVVDTKGRIASRMTNFEVFVTEILLRNVLEELDGVETAALLSCLVLPGVNTADDEDGNENPLFQPIINFVDPNQPDPSNFKKTKKDELNKTAAKINDKMEKIKSKNELIRKYLELTPALNKAIDDVQLIISDLLKQENELDIEPMEGADLNKVTFYLVPIVYAWAKGRPITEIMDVLAKNIQEGILVRWIINLHETIKDIDSASRHFLMDSSIKMKFETAIASIKRGIIDMPSLYLNQRPQSTEEIV